MEAGYGIQQKQEIKDTMKTLASALIGLSLMIGTVMAQTPAASSSTSNSTDTTKSTTKAKKHKKHAATSTTPAPATSSTPAK